MTALQPGDPIPGSRQFYAICRECREPMRTPVRDHALIGKAVCTECRGEHANPGVNRDAVGSADDDEQIGSWPNIVRQLEDG